jgi:hypothetical protein
VGNFFEYTQVREGMIMGGEIMLGYLLPNPMYREQTYPLLLPMTNQECKEREPVYRMEVRIRGTSTK